MQKETTSWFSEALNQEMPLVSYGNYGFALLLVPTAAADYLEYERFQMIDALAPLINSGKLRVFSINSINNNICQSDLHFPVIQGYITILYSIFFINYYIFKPDPVLSHC